MVGLVLASILIPFLGGVLTLITPQMRVKLFSQIVAFLTFLASLLVLVEFARHAKTEMSASLLYLGNILIFGVTIDRVSTLIGLAVILVGFLIVLYSTGYLTPQNREHPEYKIQKRYYFYLLLFIGSMAGVVYSSTMIGLLVFFELTGVCSWALIGYYDDQKARSSALKAIVVTQIASLGLYLATAVFFGLTGTFNLAAMSTLPSTAKIIIFAGILVAAWGKSAQLPMHFWLPDAMVAPTPISAYLHAASMVKVGVYILARCLISAGNVPQVIGMVGAVMAIITMVYGFLMYFPQKDMKRLLAYSTITQLSYIFFALSLSIFGSKLAYNGAVAHIFNHAFAKSLFFLVAGALSFSAGTKMLPALRGILTKMPLVGISFTCAMLSIVGVPPFNCFFSKFSILAGAFEAAHSNPILLLLVVIAILETLGSFAWMLWIFSVTVPGEPSLEIANETGITRSMQWVLGVLIVLTLVSGYFAATWMG